MKIDILEARTRSTNRGSLVVPFGSLLIDMSVAFIVSCPLFPLDEDCSVFPSSCQSLILLIVCTKNNSDRSKTTSTPAS
jgi:hypothetical protein